MTAITSPQRQDHSRTQARMTAITSLRDPHDRHHFRTEAHMTGITTWRRLA